MKRQTIDLHDLVSYDNVSVATHLAAKGKRHRGDVRAFLTNLDSAYDQLRTLVLQGDDPIGRYRRFVIHDPKRREIHAPVFSQRVLHHAMMNVAGPTFDRCLVDSSYACRVGKGAHQAVRSVQLHLRRYPWYVKIDIDSYFHHIRHACLLGLINRRFKGEGFLRLCARILAGYQTAPGRGLPIGSLCSQYFANEYLNGLDRFLLEEQKVSAHCRYMDDVMWFCESREQAIRSLRCVREYLFEARQLVIKPSYQIQRSNHGVSFCGYRVRCGALYPSRRRLKRFRQQLAKWEWAFAQGVIDERQLQQAYAGVHAILDHSDSVQWRRQLLQRRADILS